MWTSSNSFINGTDQKNVFDTRLEVMEKLTKSTSSVLNYVY